MSMSPWVVLRGLQVARSSSQIQQPDPVARSSSQIQVVQVAYKTVGAAAVDCYNEQHGKGLNALGACSPFDCSSMSWFVV